VLISGGKHQGKSLDVVTGSLSYRLVKFVNLLGTLAKRDEDCR